MKTFKIEGYEIREANGDGMTDRLLYYVSNEALAKTLTGKQHYLGYQKYSKTIRVYDTIEEIQADTKEALRLSALAKLTPAEKTVLGL